MYSSIRAFNCASGWKASILIAIMKWPQLLFSAVLYGLCTCDRKPLPVRTPDSTSTIIAIA